MRRQERRTLQILEEFKGNQTASQRQLARKLSISLGLTNASLQKLTHQGLLKIDTISGNRNRYTLTSAGLAEKQRLNQAYVKESLVVYSAARDKIIALFDELEKEGNRQIVFFGTGLLAEVAYVSLQQTPLMLVAAIAGDNQSNNGAFFDAPVVSLRNIGDFSFDIVLVTLMEPEDLIEDQLVYSGIQRNRIRFLWQNLSTLEYEQDGAR